VLVDNRVVVLGIHKETRHLIYYWPHIFSLAEMSKMLHCMICMPSAMLAMLTFTYDSQRSQGRGVAKAGETGRGC
jgi:hypothetical protein